MQKTITGVTVAILVFSWASLLARKKGKRVPQTSKTVAQVENLGQKINTKYVEFTPFVTDDEKYLYFESNRPGQIGGRGFDLWYVKNDAEEGEQALFQNVRLVGEPINSAGFDGLPSLRKISDKRYEIYFTSKRGPNRPGRGKTDIYRAEQDDDGDWQEPTLLGINTAAGELMPSISSDGKALFFASDRKGGFGKTDIYVSYYDEAKKGFFKAINLGKRINTKYVEATPAFHRDGKTLYISSNRPKGLGGFDIYYATYKLKEHKVVGRLHNLGKPYNSIEDDEYPTITADGLRIYFASSRDGGFGSYDIYRARLPVFAPPGLQYIRLLVQFQNEQEKLVLPKRVSLAIEPALQKEKPLLVKGGEYREKIFLAPLRKKGTAFLKSGDILVNIKAERKGYQTLLHTVELRELSQRQREAGHLPVSLLLTLKSKDAVTSKRGVSAKVATIYFNTSVHNRISKKSKKKLRLIFQKFKNSPDAVIKIFGHADKRNTYQYNMRLSKRRANFIRKKLMQLGIPKKKIKTRGFGYTRPAKRGKSKKALRANRRATIYFEQ